MKALSPTEFVDRLNTFKEAELDFKSSVINYFNLIRKKNEIWMFLPSVLKNGSWHVINDEIEEPFFVKKDSLPKELYDNSVMNVVFREAKLVKDEGVYYINIESIGIGWYDDNKNIWEFYNETMEELIVDMSALNKHLYFTRNYTKEAFGVIKNK